jgi:glutathione S-transferase
MPGFPEAKVKLLPTVYFPQADGGYEAQVDSTPILARLEREFAGRALVPSDPVIAFLDHLVEDFADEWLTKAMFHYRWARQADIAHAGPQLVFWHDTTTSDADAKAASDFISKRQIDRLYVVGSNEVTAATIEHSYERLVGVLEALIQPAGFVMGARPGTADFGLYGQLTQLGVVDPTPAAICDETAPRLRAWIDRSRRNLGVDTLDLVQLHCPPPATYEDDRIYDTLDALVAEEAGEFIDGLGGDDDVDVLALRELDFLFDHGEAATVGGHQRERLAFGDEQDAVQVVADVVHSHGEVHLVDQTLERLLGDGERCAEVHRLIDQWEILARQRLQRETALATQQRELFA